MPQYYPKSQITINLYTNGKEYFLINTQIPYTGYYYKLSTGKKYTGKTPDGGQGIELTPNTTISGEPPLTLLQHQKIKQMHLIMMMNPSTIIVLLWFLFIPNFPISNQGLFQPPIIQHQQVRISK